MQKIFEQKTGIDANVKSFLQSRVPERRKVAKDLEKSGAARHYLTGVGTGVDRLLTGVENPNRGQKTVPRDRKTRLICT